MARSTSLRTMMGYLVPYVLIATFQFQVAKDALNYSSPFVLMGLRYLVASSLIFGIVRRFRPILNKDTVLLSLFTCASAGLWGLGLEYVSPAESAVLSYSMPLISIPISWAILSEKATTNEWGGAVVGLLGVLIYSLPFAYHALTALGGVLTLMNAFFWGMYTVYYRKLKNQEPATTVATQLMLAGIVFLFLAPLDYRLVVAPSFWFDLAYLSILSGAVSFYLWNTMARLQKIGKTATLIYSIPVTATFLQFVVSSVMPDPLSLIGICLMIFGIYISRIEQKKVTNYHSSPSTAASTTASRLTDFERTSKVKGPNI